MKKINKPFVVSSYSYETIEEAERHALGWFNAGQLKQKTKLYKIVEIYDLKIKFVKRK